MAYSAITNAEIDQDSPITQPLMTKYRDNILAVKGMVFLSSADASSDATIDFTEFDASLYDAYEFVLINVTPSSTAVNLQIRTSTNGGSSYDSGGSDYGYELVTGGSVTVNQSTDDIRLADNVRDNFGVSGALKIYGPHLAAETMVTFDGVVDDTIGGNISRASSCGVRQSAADVDAIRFFFSSGNIASGTITMYGLWNAA